MSQIVARSADNPEFARVVDASRLRATTPFEFDVSPTPEEAEALGRLMGALEIRKMRFRGRLIPAAGGAWRLEGELGATAVQTCVATLEPVSTRVDATVRRLYAPDVAVARDGAEFLVSELEDDDEAEPLGDRIDLGQAAIEALVLALPAYPRKADAAPVMATSAPPGAKPLGEAEVKPFAALAALRSKMDEER